MLPTLPLENLSFNLGTSGYSDTSQEDKDTQILPDKLENRDKIFPYFEVTSFLPAYQAVESHNVFANQYTEVPNRNIINNNNTLKDSNNRLDDGFKFTENTKYLSNDQFTSKLACFNEKVHLNSSSSKTFLNPTGQPNHCNNFKNNNFTWHGEPPNGINTFPTHQQISGDQLFGDNERHYYEPLKVTNRFNSLETTNLLSSCQPSTGRQAYANQYDPLNNISINIGNSISFPPFKQSVKSQISSNQYLDNAGYVTKHYNASGEQSWQNVTNLKNQQGAVNNTVISRNSIFLPKHNLGQYKYGSIHQENIHSTSDTAIKPSQETINPYEQVIDISKTINNLPFQELTNLNGHLKETANNSSININNIKSINVHVHHPTNFSSSENDFLQSCPTDAPTHMWRNNYDDLLPNAQNNIGSSTSQHCENFGNGLIWTSMDLNPSDAYRYIDPPRNILRDDIYLPTSDESCQSNNIDEWLDTIDFTPLDPYTEQSYELYLGSESQGSTDIQQFNEVLSNVSKKENNKKKRARSKINKETLNILKRWYEKVSYPNYSQQQQISEQTGHSVDTVRIWFQNRRQAMKRRNCMDISSEEKTVLANNEPDQSLETQGSFCASKHSPQINFNVMQIHENYLNHAMNVKENAPLASN